jgi:regulator of PEP synthase PpsR (kinase-PPPase family)
MKDKKTIYIISDSTGLTAESVIRTVIPQFKDADFEISRITRVRSSMQVAEAIQLASKTEGIIVHTLVSEELRKALLSESAQYEVPTVDLIGPLMTSLSDLFEATPLISPGLQHKLSERYFHRIESIEYTINHDDGRNPDGLHEADVIIVGVSRTSKTPLSIFLSNQYALKVANIPIILGVELPPQLFKLNSEKIVGLTISPLRLMEIRRIRIQRLGESAESKYADYSQILNELKYSHQLFASNAWTVIDVTEKSVEETASEIIELTNTKRFLFD